MKLHLSCGTVTVLAAVLAELFWAPDVEADADIKYVEDWRVVEWEADVPAADVEAAAAALAAAATALAAALAAAALAAAAADLL